jgi:hypothetical protein
LLPLKVYRTFSTPEDLKVDLKKVGGVYGFFNLKDGKQYIGSSSNLYERFTDHVKGVSSNIRLQRSIAKHGLNNFSFLIFYYHKDPAVLLTEMETEVIKSFPFEDLYNFKKEANSMLGYKHTADAIAKMKLRLSDKSNHPMYRKKHTIEALQSISTHPYPFPPLAPPSGCVARDRTPSLRGPDPTGSAAEREGS